MLQAQMLEPYAALEAVLLGSGCCTCSGRRGLANLNSNYQSTVGGTAVHVMALLERSAI